MDYVARHYAPIETWFGTTPGQKMYPLIKVIAMDTNLFSSRWRSPFSILIFFLAFVIVSCVPSTPGSPEQSAVYKATQTAVLPSESPIVKPAETLYPPTETTIVSLSTKTVPRTPQTVDVSFRVSYVTNELDDQNEVIRSNLWVLYPPYDSTQLLYSTENGKQNNIISSPCWSHDGRRVAFAHLAGDEQHIAFSISDIETKEVTQITSTLAFDHPFNSSYTIKWSSDDQWLYLDYFFNFSNGQIVNTMTKESFKLDSRTQDELAGWSPVVGDQYVSMSRKNFPDTDGDILCLNHVREKEPLKCFKDLDYTLLTGKIFSWSPNGDRALIVVNDDIGNSSYLLLDFTDMSWELLFVNEYFEVVDSWSPDNRWVAFYHYERAGSSIYLFDMDQEVPKLVLVADKRENSRLIGWLSNGQWIVYQVKNKIFMVNPIEPGQPILLNDFSNLQKYEYQIFQVDILGAQFVP